MPELSAFPERFLVCPGKKCWLVKVSLIARPKVLKPFFMLNSTEYETWHAYKN